MLLDFCFLSILQNIPAPLPPTNDFTVFGSERDVDLKDGELMEVEENSEEVAEHKGHHNHHQYHLRKNFTDF